MSSSSEPNSNGIDPTVGGLVWVRRRNGSWWPGRIMGLHELSESFPVSPRSGTPVKLLGREDASIDWYNLEKSKRVKAFRCGEYDECIRKAKASANGSRKAVKYARREDAILHALELESALQRKDRPDFFSHIDNSGGECSGRWLGKSPVSSSASDENESANAEEVSALKDDSISAQELSQSGLSFKESDHISAPTVNAEKGRRRTPNDSEDDGGQGSKRMRGLEDLGMGITPKGKHYSNGVMEHSDSDTSNCASLGSPVNSSKDYFPSLKRKRSLAPHVYEFLKKKNRRRPLTKVLESTAMVSVPIMCDELPNSCLSSIRGVSNSGFELNEARKHSSVLTNNRSESVGVSCVSGTILLASSKHKPKENGISIKSEPAAIDSLERLYDVPFVGDATHRPAISPWLMSCSSQKPQVASRQRQCSQNSQAEILPLKTEVLNKSASTSSMAVYGNSISERMEKGTSKWQIKGKRNSRNLCKSKSQDSKRSADTDDESNGCLAGWEHFDGSYRGSDQKADCNTSSMSLASDSCDFQMQSKSTLEDQDDGFQDCGKHISLRDPQLSNAVVEVKSFPDCSSNSQRMVPCRQPRFSVIPRYQMPEFPFQNLCLESSLYDVNLEVRANYRPQDVPLVSLMSKLNGKAIIGHPLMVEALDDSFCDILIGNTDCYPTRSSCDFDDAPYDSAEMEYGRSPTKRLRFRTLSPRKLPRVKKHGSMSKKTRRLSSLTGQGRYKEERKPVVEKLKGPAIACVPLTVVFSRISEALNYSTRAANPVLASSNP
ncbi:PWWP domain [Dillenia turbinata]|uniref:PWWP domain n=1 Tax=Dillenia turbinata TaxID=194707 RepID=A0AAN8UAV6_9MAGN